MRNKRFLIVNSWHDSNKGDCAIVLGSIDALRASYGNDCQITVTTYLANRSPFYSDAFRHIHKAHPGVETLPPSLPVVPRFTPPGLMIRRLARAILKLMFPRLLPSKPDERALSEADVVIDAGGLHFAFPSRNPVRLPIRPFLFAYPMALARRFGKTTVLYGHSFGPFNTALSRLVMRKLLGLADHVLVRESESMQTAERLGVPRQKLRRIPDPAFAIRADKSVDDVLTRHGLKTGQFVAVSVRQLPGAPRPAADRYFQSIATLIEHLIQSRNVTVSLVAHTLGPTPEEDDRLAITAVLERLDDAAAGNVVVIDEDLAPPRLAAVYGQALIVVATRFHATVLSIVGGTPPLSLSYFGSKATGTMRDLGLSSFSKDAADIDPDELCDTVDRMMEDHKTLRDQISQLAVQLRNEALGVPGILTSAPASAVP